MLKNVVQIGAASPDAGRRMAAFCREAALDAERGVVHVFALACLKPGCAPDFVVECSPELLLSEAYTFLGALSALQHRMLTIVEEFEAMGPATPGPGEGGTDGSAS